ncbi:MAG: DegV family protein [Oscillospiraceae bacterium]|nr:DegV family protein [Oscillospiraceae bacterium]
MGKVLIFGDSTCDLPPEWRKKLGVGFMPLPVNVGADARLDMHDVFPGEVFEYYKKTGTLCTTSAPNTMDYVDFWTKVREREPGCEILHFHISSDMTVTHQVADMAAKEFENIWSIDTKSVSIGVAALLLEACRLRDAGKSGREIFDAIEKIKSRVKVSFVIDSVEFLHKGGRCSGLAALGANLLNLHPAISMKDGVLSPGKKYRGSMKNVSKSYLTDALSDKSLKLDQNRILVANTSFNEEMNNYLLEIIRALRPDIKEIIFSQPGCSVCVHCGPNTIGIAYIPKE